MAKKIPKDEWRAPDVQRKLEPNELYEQAPAQGSTILRAFCASRRALELYEQAPAQVSVILPPPRSAAIRIHFQRALVVKLGGSFCGAQGLANWSTTEDMLLAKDASGVLLSIDGKAAFVPWANISWIEFL